MNLTKEQRDWLQQWVGDRCMDTMFGDGLERDYIIDGFPEFKGVANMTDEELLEEAGYDKTSDQSFEEFQAQLNSEYEGDEEDDE